jgi:hypothetical protein
LGSTQPAPEGFRFYVRLICACARLNAPRRAPSLVDWWFKVVKSIIDNFWGTSYSEVKIQDSGIKQVRRTLASGNDCSGRCSWFAATPRRRCYVEIEKDILTGYDEKGRRAAVCKSDVN